MQPSIAQAPAFLRFRDSHHAVARWFAQGLTISEVSDKTGYSRRRLHLLLSDPTFQELVASYHKEADAEFRRDIDAYDDLQRKNMILAEQQIADRLDRALEDDDEKVPLHILDRISQSRADRTGYSKHTKHTVEVGFADALDRAIERSDKARVINHSPKQIEAQPIPAPISAPQAKTDAVVVGPRPRRDVSFVPILQKKNLK